jgi:hypothetical protein
MGVHNTLGLRLFMEKGDVKISQNEENNSEAVRLSPFIDAVFGWAGQLYKVVKPLSGDATKSLRTYGVSDK